MKPLRNRLETNIFVFPRSGGKIGLKEGKNGLKMILYDSFSTKRRRRVVYLRKPPVSATVAFGVIAWTASSIMTVRARASALLTALEMSP